jgi:hypothetical protein
MPFTADGGCLNGGNASPLGLVRGDGKVAVVAVAPEMLGRLPPSPPRLNRRLGSFPMLGRLPASEGALLEEGKRRGGRMGPFFGAESGGEGRTGEISTGSRARGLRDRLSMGAATIRVVRGDTPTPATCGRVGETPIVGEDSEGLGGGIGLKSPAVAPCLLSAG